MGEEMVKIIVMKSQLKIMKVTKRFRFGGGREGGCAIGQGIYDYQDYDEEEDQLEVYGFSYSFLIEGLFQQ
ncbi:MAG: hypothetical protein EZS28_035170 [Streblomastix strix]|uniref:Uncharacterized protein n=1 Tax=Streblomastix strix TaxID=222440 RepID=A0A5J4UGE3_9EUKA|nr:MAG: hypothetical protein EZS28_035170 [Streblomastix strix]